MKKSYKRHSMIPPTVKEEGESIAPPSRFKKQPETKTIDAEEIGTVEDR